MKKSLVLAMAMALGVTASAYAANPFSDVPAGHWAYDSVAKLAAAGVVDGYTDGAFAGDKLITRYEMAQIVAKAMAKGADCDKLAAEFADELDTLGVRVAKLEKGADAVKISGAIRARYCDSDAGNTNDFRTRLWINGQVNEDWAYTAMFQHTNNWDNDKDEEGNTKFQRAYVTGKLGGLDVTAGRYNAYFGDGLVYDTRADAVEASYNVGGVKVTGFVGKGTDTGYGDDGWVSKQAASAAMADEADSYGDYVAVELATQVAGLDLTAGYADFNEMRPGLYEEAIAGAVGGLDNKIWWAQVGKTVGHVGVKAAYLKGDFEGLGGYAKYGNDNFDDDGYAFAVSYKGAKASEVGSWGMRFNYWNQGAATYVAHTTDADVFSGMGFKGYGIAADYTVAKNIIATVAWYDTEAKNKEITKEVTGANENEILWADVTFLF